MKNFLFFFSKQPLKKFEFPVKERSEKQMKVLLQQILTFGRICLNRKTSASVKIFLNFD